MRQPAGRLLVFEILRAMRRPIGALFVMVAPVAGVRPCMVVEAVFATHDRHVSTTFR